MKLRLSDGSIRLRLDEDEIAALSSGRALEMTTRFGAAHQLSCSLLTGDGPASAVLDGTTITITVPRDAGRSSVYRVEHLQQWAGGSLQIVVEQDLGRKRKQIDQGTGPR